jgi:putative ABC transport system substrate-binding protein
MKRRAILLASAAWFAAAAAPTFSQSKPPRRIAVVLPGSRAGYQSRFDAFRSELKKLGYVEGRDLLIDIRWGEDRIEGLAALVAEALSLNPEVIVTASSAGVAAVSKATSSVPIVFATAGNVVEQGFVASLSRPGGNITGVISYVDITQKIVELAREALPAARRLALLVYDADPVHKFAVDAFELNAQRFKFEPMIVRFSRPEDLDRAFSELAEGKADAVILPNLTFFSSQPSEVVRRALKARLPVLSNSTSVVESGGLLSYGTRWLENYRRAAALVDKILRGAKPGDLPIEQPERFQLVVNRKTANAIGVTLSPVTMLRADRFID